MRLGRVIGTVNSTVKIQGYRDQKLLLVRPIDPRRADFGQAAGGVQIAIDRAQAGVGDTVLILDEGNSARQMLGDSLAPVRTVVVGVVDRIDMVESQSARREGE